MDYGPRSSRLRRTTCCEGVLSLGPSRCRGALPLTVVLNSAAPPCLPSCLELIRLSLSPWNSSSLLGTLRSSGSWQTAKRRNLATLFAKDTVVALQETRGGSADFSFLLGSQGYSWTCLTSDGGDSRAGGTTLAISKSLVGQAAEITRYMHQRGRMRLGGWL